MQIKNLIAALSVLIVVGLAGCAGVKNSMRLSEKNSAWNPVEMLVEKRASKSEENPQPNTMAVIWKDAKMDSMGQPAKRGFGGRLYFYDAANNACPAEGTLVVYAFDSDSGTPEKPDRKFEFRKEDFQQHFSESPLGASYSVWLPVDDFHNSFDKLFTLIPFFITDDGRKIQGDQTTVALGGQHKRRETKGKKPFEFLGTSSSVVGASHHGNKASRDRVRRADYNSSESAEAEPKSGMRVTGLKLTANLQRRIAAANQAEKNSGGALSRLPANRQEAWPSDDSNQLEGGSTRQRVQTQPVAPDESNPRAAENHAEPTPERRVFGQPGQIR